MLNYVGKLILGPMVSIGTLPMRLLALRYGADIAYTEELIDFNFKHCTRRVNNILKTIDFINHKNGSILFRTCEEERHRVVLQIGTCDIGRAVHAAKLVENDVAAIDVNMGCPTDLAIQCGLGAALLQHKDKSRDILKALVENVKIPVTCKIRILETPEETLDVVNNLISTGISAIAIHGRTKDERPREPDHPDVIKYIAERVDIPVIANGGSLDIEKYSDIEKYKRLTGCSSVMISRAAIDNCSIFRKEGLLPLDEVLVEYLKLAVDYDNKPTKTKFFLQRLLVKLTGMPVGKQLFKSKNLEDICTIWEIEDYCRMRQNEYKQKGLQDWLLNQIMDYEIEIIKPVITELKVQFIKSKYASSDDLPKRKLHLFAKSEGKDLPIYETECENSKYRTLLKFDKKLYASSHWENNKIFADHSAAIVCLYTLGLLTEKQMEEYECVVKCLE